MQFKKPIGILGGMGPEASVYMYKTLIEKAITEFGAKNNEDFPEIILYSVPVPDFISSEARQNEASAMLIDRTKQLNKLDVSCIGIACNTAHLLLPELQKESSIDFISMIDTVVNKTLKDKKLSLGILGTPTTIRTKLYQRALEEKGIVVYLPDKQKLNKLEEIIRNVIKNEIQNEDKVALQGIADSLVDRGAEAIILGCTELPLVFPKKYKVLVYNSVELLSSALLQKYYNSNKMGKVRKSIT